MYDGSATMTTIHKEANTNKQESAYNTKDRGQNLDGLVTHMTIIAVSVVCMMHMTIIGRIFTLGMTDMIAAETIMALI